MLGQGAQVGPHFSFILVSQDSWFEGPQKMKNHPKNLNQGASQNVQPHKTGERERRGVTNVSCPVLCAKCSTCERTPLVP